MSPRTRRFVAVPPSVGGPFSPLSLFTGGRQGLWYDPSDLTALFQNTNGTTAVTTDNDVVGYITDKGPNTHPAVAFNDNRRGTYNTSGGLHWLTLTDSPADPWQYLVATAVSITNNVGYCTIIAGIRPADNAQDKNLWLFGNNAGNNRANIRCNSTEDWQIGGRRLDGDSNTLSTGSALSTSTDYVITAQFKWAEAKLIGRLNGAVDINNTSWLTSGNTSATDSGTVRLSANGSSTNGWHGRLYGIIVVIADLDSTEISNAEAWMAEKAGVTL